MRRVIIESPYAAPSMETNPREWRGNEYVDTATGEQLGRVELWGPGLPGQYIGLDRRGFRLAVDGDGTMSGERAAVERHVAWRDAEREAGRRTRRVALHLDYLCAAMADCLRRGEAPFASHGLYTQPGVLDDNAPDQRDLGIEAGFAWHSVAEAVVVYEDFGDSPGMQRGIENAKRLGLPVERRRLGWSVP